MGLQRALLSAMLLAAALKASAASWQSGPRSLESLKALRFHPIFVSLEGHPISRELFPEFAASPLRVKRGLAGGDVEDLLQRPRALLSLRLAGRPWDLGLAFDPGENLLLLVLSSPGEKCRLLPLWKPGGSLGVEELSRLRKGASVPLGRGAVYRFRLALRPMHWREPFALDISAVPPSRGRGYTLTPDFVLGLLSRQALVFKASGRTFWAFCARDADFKGRVFRDSSSLMIFEPPSKGALRIPLGKLARAPFEVRWGELGFLVELAPGGRLVISEWNSVK